MKTMRLFTLGLALTASLSACHKDLCWDHDDHALTYEVRLNFHYDQSWHEDYSYYKDPEVDVDGSWVVEATDYFDEEMPELRPSKPKGVRCLLYDEDGNRRTYNLGTNGGTVQVTPGDHQMLFFNNDSEYIVFADDPDVSGITVTTRAVSRSSYQGSPYVNTGTRAENTVSAPDMLYFSYVENYSVVHASETPDTLHVDMSPLVCTYVIRFNFARGGEYVALARGALAGMAGSVKLYNGESFADNLSTVLFDCNVCDDYAQAEVNTFGVPGYQLNSNVDNFFSRSRSENSFGLNLELRLVNGVILTMDYDVTDQVALQPQGGVITINDIQIDEVQEVGSGSGSGLNVNVDGWGEYKDYLLPLDN